VEAKGNTTLTEFSSDSESTVTAHVIPNSKKDSSMIAYDLIEVKNF
jgi:hypothetical protein